MDAANVANAMFGGDVKVEWVRRSRHRGGFFFAALRSNRHGQHFHYATGSDHDSALAAVEELAGRVAAAMGLMWAVEAERSAAAQERAERAAEEHRARLVAESRRRPLTDARWHASSLRASLGRLASARPDLQLPDLDAALVALEATLASEL